MERRTRHHLAGEVDRRIHILEGRMIAFLNIEEVIRVIRESDEPKPALIAAFGLSDVQARDITRDPAAPALPASRASASKG